MLPEWSSWCERQISYRLSSPLVSRGTSRLGLKAPARTIDFLVVQLERTASGTNSNRSDSFVYSLIKKTRLRSKAASPSLALAWLGEASFCALFASDNTTVPAL